MSDQRAHGTVAAIDLGASSGRVAIGRASRAGVVAEIVARFPNHPVRSPDGLRWDLAGLYRSSIDGLRAALRVEPEIASIAVDSWAVDYGLLHDGRLLADPFHYRDERSARGVEATDRIVDREELYRQNGLQFLPFNTLYQLVADRLDGRLAGADAALLIPDLVNFWLTGASACERTNASTTGLVDIATGEWNDALLDRLSIPSALFPDLVAPGEHVGRTGRDLTAALGVAQPIDVVAVGSHDTASAIVAVPMEAANSAYISCGTWGLVGVELEAPILSEASRAANFTNELGVDGRIRFLHNVMGLWLLSECVRWWSVGGEQVEIDGLLRQAAAVSSDVAVVDVDDQRFSVPDDMPRRLADYCDEHDLPRPASRAELTRCILESLAHGFARAVRRAATLSGRHVDRVHVVGGGAQNALLCQLTADRVGADVLAGPVEATALGNVLVQARAAGFVGGDLEALRALVRASTPLVHYAPRATSDVRLHIATGLDETT